MFNCSLEKILDKGSNLVNLLCYRALHQPDQKAYIFLVDGEYEEVSITYQELDQRARAIAAQLQSLSVVGKRALLLYPQSLDFITAFFGCLYAGVIAVPVYPPNPARPDRTLPKLRAIVKNAQPLLSLTNSSILSKIKASLSRDPDYEKIRWLATDTIAIDLANEWQNTGVNSETIAFLQYTSGSTGTPKGVMVSHGNLLHNSSLIYQYFEHTHDSKGVSWLPFFHDMGLVGGVLQPIYGGFPVVLMSPSVFLQKPFRWLNAISRYKATTSGGPNFAYDLCVRKITPEERANLDLSSWDLAFNGSEPVRAETMGQFAATFQSCGFRREAFYPCYGMAEATVFISGGMKKALPVLLNIEAEVFEQGRIAVSAGDKGSELTIVGCGRSGADQKIVIADPESLTLCSAGEAGEIWVSGPSVAQGYWRNKEETVHTFQAYMSGGEGPFLRTGDLGFLKDGELFVTGRLKDLIIIRGRNYYPQDIELTVEQSHPALRHGYGAAFSIKKESEERLVVAQEVERSYLQKLDVNEVIRTIRQAVSEHHELQVYAVLLLKTGTIPKTTSGKIQRRSCRADFLANSLDVMKISILEDFAAFECEDFPLWDALLVTSTEERKLLLESHLRRLISSMLKVSPSQLGLQQPLTTLGIDSLLAVQIISWIRDTFQVELPIQSLFESTTITGLTEYLMTILEKQAQNKDPMRPLPQIVSVPDQRYQPFPLTDIQQAYWVGRNAAFELGNVAAHVYLEIEGRNLDPKRLSSTWRQLIERHEMLRAVVLPSGEQKILEQVPPYEIKVVDLQGYSPEKINTQLKSIRDQMSHQVLPADRWPLFEIRATSLGKQRLRIHFSLDLLIADFWSLIRLFREWNQLYLNQDTSLPILEVSFRDYVLTEKSLQDLELYKKSQDYWFSRIDTLPPAPELPLSQNPASLQQPRFRRRSSKLATEIWQQLKHRATQSGLTPSGMLLAAFAEILTLWSKSPRFTINLTLFHRLPLHPQVNDIIGDFTSVILLAVNNAGSESFISRASRLQQQLWQDLDHRYVSGVHVLRELTRRQGGAQGAVMPVVFTSTLGLGSSDLIRSDQNTFGSNLFGDVVYSISQTPQVWLDHQVIEQEGTLVFNWDAVDNLFPESLLDDMFEAYCYFLRQLAISETIWIEASRQLVPQAQLSQRADVNATAAPVSEEMLHTLFTSQVEAGSDRWAVISPHRSLTYRELYHTATQVGWRLRQLGASPNMLIAVVMEKSWEQVVAVIGVLMSGGAYLPIDPELPTDRRWYLLKEGEVEIVLTQSKLNGTLEWPEGIQRVCVDSENLASAHDQPLEATQSPEDLAYVIYTSGSTGLPKGVMIDHRGAVNTIKDINRRFAVGPQDRVLALSALNFDISVWDIFGTLGAGGSIIVPQAGATKDPSHWAELMVQHRVTIWNSVPALLQMLVEYLMGQPEKVSTSLRLALLSGDWIPTDLPDRIKELVKNIEIISLGGATEASIWSIFYPIETVDPSWKSIPYGKPLTNQNFQILNDSMEPVPVWVTGQLYIGGIGLAKGYWKDEEKTNARFIIHPHSKERLYKTGDLGRYLPDGNIEFLGRDDFQVKISGYRIELGEIEATLKQHPAVKEVVVNAVGNEREYQSIAAYVVADQGRISPSQQGLVEDYQSPQVDGVLMYPIDRLEFKLRQPGLRQKQPKQSSIQLVRPDFDEALTKAYLERQSYRHFLEESISFEQFSLFLSCLLQIKLDSFPLPKYRYPSAGNLYPVQTYLYIKPNRVNGVDAGIYYYHPAEHSLLSIHPEPVIIGSSYSEYGGANQPIFEQSAFSLFLVADLNAISPLYGEWARDFCMIETGYIGQLLMSIAPNYRIGLCPIGYMNFEKIQNLFDLKASHVFLHSFLGGKIDTAQTKQWLPPQTSLRSGSIADELRSYLQNKLPGYMVPSALVLLDALPLTTNGKVDRKALREMDIFQSKSKTGFVPPQTEVEKIIAAIVQEVLSVKEIGIHNNFFDLGANSVSLVQIHSKLKNAMNKDIPIVEMFRHPTISFLARHLSQEQGEKTYFQQIYNRAEERKAARQKRLMSARTNIVNRGGNV